MTYVKRGGRGPKSLSRGAGGAGSPGLAGQQAGVGGRGNLESG